MARANLIAPTRQAVGLTARRARRNLALAIANFAPMGVTYTP